MKGVVALSLLISIALPTFAQAQARRPAKPQPPAQAAAPAQPAAPATGRTAPYPEGPASAFKATVQKGIVTINKDKVVYTEEFMANSCLITVAQLPGKKPLDRKSTRLNSSHIPLSRMPSSA